MERGLALEEKIEYLETKYHEIKESSDKFILGTNHPEGAFHGFRHFKNVSEAAKKLLAAAQGDDENLPNDPTYFWESLENFCKVNTIPIEMFDNQTLETSMDLFGMIHDLGNAFAGVKETQNGLEFVNLKDKDGKNKFYKKGAEKRSIRMTETVAKYYLKDQGLTESKQSAIIKLVKALTAETTFCISDRNKPFAVFTRITDQIGQALVDPNQNSMDYTKEVQIPLLHEEYNDPRGFKSVEAKKYGNFVSAQLPALCGKYINQNEILKIFGFDKIPDYLIYENDDPRLKELKLHPLHLRGELIRRLESHAKRWRIDDLQTTAGGYMHEILAEIELRNGAEAHPLEKEIIKVLQNPRDFGFSIDQMPRNPDLIKLTYDVTSGVWTLTSVEDAKRSSVLNDRCIEQFSDSGILKGIQLLCRVLNNAKPSTLERWGLKEAVRIRKDTSQEKIIEIDGNFKIHIILPSDAKDLKIIDNPKDSVKADEVSNKIGTTIIAIKTHHTQDEITKLVPQLLKDYQLSTTFPQR